METDLYLITKVKEENDSFSLQELINRHSGMYIDTVNRTVSESCSFMDKKNILSDVGYSIYNAALKFDPGKHTKFSTYLANETRWRCLNMYNKNKKMIEEPLDESIKEKASSSDFLVNLQNEEIYNKIIEQAIKNPDKRVKKIIDMRYAIGYNKPSSWREISEELDMSIQGCIDIHNKFIKKVRKVIKNV